MNIKHLWIKIGLSLLVLASLSLLPIAEERAISVSAKSSISEQTQSLHQEAFDPPKSLRVQLKNSEKAVELSLWREFMEEEGARSTPRFIIDPTSELSLFAGTEVKDGKLTVYSRLEGSELKNPLENSTSKRLGNWLSLVPPMVAVLLALVFQKILLALLTAVWVGVTISASTDPFSGIWFTITDILVPVLSSGFNLQILGFTFALIGMVSLVTRMGGTRGLIERISKRATNPQRTQVATGLMGLVIFFDDYANTVVVGSAARKLTDAMKISREKLAYIVDSTSAPIAGIALVSTWIGYEVGLFTAILPELHGVEGLPAEGYGLFFEALPLRFYCIFALILVFLSALMKRDMGPMLRAERRARAGLGVLPTTDTSGGKPAQTEDELEKPGVPARWWNAAIPILAVLFGTLGSIAMVGGGDDFALFNGESWRDAFAGAEDHIPTILFVSALSGGLIAFILSLSQRLLTPTEAVKSYSMSMVHLAEAGAILILAWAIKDVCYELNTGHALVALVGESIPSLVLPLVIFLLSGVVAFFTGTSWGTMALLLPVAAPLAASMTGEALIVIACVGAVLDGAIWGDHCSPISDTTVLSSTATGCPHVDHVKTQIPYAFLAMTAAGVGGYLGIAGGAPIWVAYLCGLMILISGLLMFGGNPEEPEKG